MKPASISSYLGFPPMMAESDGQTEGSSASSSGPAGKKGGGSTTAAGTSPPVRGHDGRFQRKKNAPLVHVDVADSAAEIIYEDGRIREILVKTDDPTKIILEEVFVGGGAHPVLYDSVSRTIKLPWTVVLHENNKGHGIKIVGGSRRGGKPNVTISTLHREDYFDGNPVCDGITMYSLHDDTCMNQRDGELKSISVRSAQGNVEYKCDTRSPGKSKSGVHIGV
jgi:hypothetical protein